ncbi:uncharacterized protein G2W53_002728 [Senna tora]|uniref:Uncharacterized protein n=1 Tax=Senna tora TaxID=362788 RepID=A0A834X907_9FABA|nr:uncharacterized protein G2W53_002728 [Senna tora]
MDDAWSFDDADLNLDSGHRTKTLHTCPGVTGPETTIFDPSNQLETAKRNTEKTQQDCNRNFEIPDGVSSSRSTCGMEATDWMGRVRE